MELEQTIIIFLYKGKKKSCQRAKNKNEKKKPIRDYMLKRESERERELHSWTESTQTKEIEKNSHIAKESERIQRDIWRSKKHKQYPEFEIYVREICLHLVVRSDKDLLPSCSSSTPSLSLSLSLSVCLFLCVREKRTKTEKMFLYDFPFV